MSPRNVHYQSTDLYGGPEHGVNDCVTLRPAGMALGKINEILEATEPTGSGTIFAHSNLVTYDRRGRGKKGA